MTRHRSRLRDTISWLESGIGTRRGGTAVFALALFVFGLRSIALPVIPGRDFGTYIGYYVQMWDWHSVVPMSMLFRTPLAPLVLGGTLDLLGGWGLQSAMALLFAASVVVVDEDGSRVRTARGRRDRGGAARVSGLRDPLPHAGERARCRRRVRWMGARRLACVAQRPATDASPSSARRLRRQHSLARAFQVLVLVAALPVALRLSWRMRLACVAACAGVGARAPGLMDRRERTPLRRLHGRPRLGRVLPLLPSLHDRSHRPARQRAALRGS